MIRDRWRRKIPASMLDDSSRLRLTLAFVVVAASVCRGALVTTLRFSTGEIALTKVMPFTALCLHTQQALKK